MEICKRAGIEYGFNDQMRAAAGRTIISSIEYFRTKDFQPIVQLVTVNPLLTDLNRFKSMTNCFLFCTISKKET